MNTVRKVIVVGLTLGFGIAAFWLSDAALTVVAATVHPVPLTPAEMDLFRGAQNNCTCPNQDCGHRTCVFSTGTVGTPGCSGCAASQTRGTQNPCLNNGQPDTGCNRACTTWCAQHNCGRVCEQGNFTSTADCSKPYTREVCEGTPCDY